MTAATTSMAITKAPAPIPASGMTTGAVRTWLRLEGFAAFVIGVALFGASGGNWLLLIPLLVLPDVSAIGYLAGPRIGSFTYNLVHNWVPGFVTLGIGVWLASPAITLAAAILIAHVGMDRAAGYGLKLPSSFHDTHLGRMGRSRA
jgi:Domain of unknown function (DUF4260)